MSENHNGGNAIPEITREEHDGSLNAKRVSIVAGAVGNATVNIAGSATIYAVVNTAAAGDSVNNIGFATVAISNPTLFAVVNTGAPGITNSIVTIANTPLSTQIVGNVTISDSKNYIGLVTASTLSITVPDPGNSTASVLGSNGTFIGTGFDMTNYSSWSVSIFADKNSATNGLKVDWSEDNINWDFTDATDFIASVGNMITFGRKAKYVRLNYTNTNSAQTIFRVNACAHPTFTRQTRKFVKNQITDADTGQVVISAIQGHTSAGGGAWVDVKVDPSGALNTKFSGNVTLDAGSLTGIRGNITISDSKTYIGLTTATIGNSPVLGSGVGNIGFATVNQVNQPALVTGAAYIGLASVNIGGTLPALSAGAAYVGLVTAVVSSTARSITGNVTLSDAKTYIGLTTSTIGNTPTVFLGTPTLYAVVNTGAAGDPKTYIGLTTTTLGISDRFIGLVTVGNTVSSSIVGNLTISDSQGFIGLTTSVNGQAWPDPKTFIGLVTVGNTVSTTFSGNVTLSDAKTYIGLVTATLDNSRGIGVVGNVTLSDSKTYIGLNTVTVGVGNRFIGLVTVVQSSSARTITGNLTLSDSKGFIGLATTVNGAGTQFIGLVTAWTRNAGSAKTLTPYSITLSTSSVVTIAVPTNAQSMYITNMVLSSDATVRVSIKSGVTYMTGNASLGISLNPGGGFVMSGSPDSPSWIGLPSGSLVIEKFDMTATKANVGGTVITFTE